MCMYVDEIIDVVNDFVDDTKMFTAWDVTVELRKQSKNRIQHFEVKKEVHRIFDQGNMFGYNRALANLPNIALQPWIYHPLNADPNMYMGNVVAITPASTPVVPSTCSISMTTPPKNDYHYYGASNRLCIPNKLIRQLGLRKGHEVLLLRPLTSNDEVVIKPKRWFIPNGSSPVAVYTVDKHDNVRIPRSTLNKAGLVASAFEISGDVYSVKIKKSVYF